MSRIPVAVVARHDLGLVVLAKLRALTSQEARRRFVNLKAFFCDSHLALLINIICVHVLCIATLLYSKASLSLKID